jgi:tryptophan synthase alpha chain
MNNRITKVFNELKKKEEKALIAFITGGDPDIETTGELILALEEGGVDIVEIGIPFSDPIAEGVVIQEAADRALLAGCTVDKLFEMVEGLRNKTNMPLLFMTYANPIYAYGKERFMAKCKEVGIDGIIIPDVPFEEKDEFEKECLDNEIALISLIAPTTGERIDKIARSAGGFLYCVSSLGVTGVREEINTDVEELIKQVKEISSVPCAIGFGISTPKQARELALISDGVIVGSAIVRLIGEYGRDSVAHVKQFVREMKESME